MGKSDTICFRPDCTCEKRDLSGRMGMASANTGAVDGSTFVTCWEVMSGVPSGSVHRSVVASFLPHKIVAPLYLTMHSFFVNVTSHLASVNTLIPKSEAMERSRMIWPMSTNGRPSSECRTCVLTLLGGRWRVIP